MEDLTRTEIIKLMAFIKTQINNNIAENIKEDISKIYFKLEKILRYEIVESLEIKDIEYSATNPIKYFLQKENKTEILNYKDAIKIVYAVIDSLGGSYKYLDELTSKYEED